MTWATPGISINTSNGDILSNPSNNSKALKSGIWYTASNFLVRSIGFITTPIFTRLLTHAEFGLYNNYISWLAILTILVTLNLDSTLISARYDFEDTLDEYILSTLSLSTLSTVIWLAAANLFPAFFENYLGMDLVYVNTMLVYLLFLPAVHLFQARERYYFEYKMTVATSLFISVGTAALSVLMVVSMEDKLAGRIFGSAIPTIVLGAILYLFFIKKGRKLTLGYWKYALPICLPFIPHLLSLSALNSMDRIMITRWCGAEDNAIYSLAYTCGAIVTLLMTSMNSAFAPWLGEKLNYGKHEEIRSFSKIYVLGFSFLAVGIMALAPEVLAIMGPKSYSDGKYVITPIAMGCVCQFLYTLFVNVEQFKRKTVGMAFASVFAALVNYVLNYVFIPKVGYLAAAYTTLAGYLCLLVIHMLLVYRLKLSDVYDYKMISITVVVMMGITVLISFMYSYNIVRYIFILVYFIVFIMILMRYKDKLLNLVKGR